MNKTTLTHRFVRGLHLLVFAALLAGLGLSPARVAHAATFTVNDTGDAGDNNPGDGTCATAGGVCTLRAAIEQANALAGDDTINFSVTGTITLGGTELYINSNMTITGPGADQLTISGNNTSRVFRTNSGTVTMSGLTIANGDAGDEEGGGIYNYNGELTLTNCTVSGNTAGYYGGGIYNYSADVTLTNCTVSGNIANDDGGGIYNDVGEVTLTNCTVSGNTANDDGGGIYDLGDADFKNTIIANNTAIDEGPNCDGDLDSYGYNLVEDTSDCTINEVANPGTDITGQDPNLGPLQDNGGPTFTHALLPGSPAIDAASCKDKDDNDVTQDQRGVSRPQPAGGDCDIGAYEVELFTLTVTKAGSGTGTVTSNHTGIFCGADCTETYAKDTVVTLTATPDAGSGFVGWGGDCSGADPTTTVTMDADKTCTATFDKQFRLTVNKDGGGTGTVTSAPAGIFCGAACTSNYFEGTLVTLTAHPGVKSYFVGWSGTAMPTAKSPWTPTRSAPPPSATPSAALSCR